VIDGLYAAANGMQAQQGMIDAISNNLANLSTPSYKSQRYSFQDLLYQQQGVNRAVSGGTVGSGAKGVDMGLSMTQGPIEASTNPLDLAIDGPGFFQVTLANGEPGLYRAGQFRIDANRDLVTPEGNKLIPNIRVPAGVDPASLEISAEGVVVAAGKQIGKITLVNVPNPSALQPLGGSLYAVNAESGPISQGGTGYIRQGAQEGSNVDSSLQFTELIQAQRTYDLCSRSVRTWDEMLQTANQIRR
jgi:flagellar basal-body rod protein FlgG